MRPTSLQSQESSTHGGRSRGRSWSSRAGVAAGGDDNWGAIVICREARRLLDPFIDNELDPVDSADVRVHLASCDACRRLLADSESLGRLVRLLPYYPASDQLREILRLSTRPRFNPGVLIGAAVLALAVSFWAISDLNDAELGAFRRALQR